MANIRLRDCHSPEYLPQSMSEFWDFAGLPELRERCERLSKEDVPLLILGETGSGKSTLAHWIHFSSARANSPFAVRGCGSFHDNTFVATLFGYEKGAYTGADRRDDGLLRGCDGGTLVLDDIDTLTMESQARLLNFLDQQLVSPLGAPNNVYPVNVRIIATSNRCLPDLIKVGQFREDLYYRLATFRIRIPPLAVRPADIGRFVRKFEGELSQEYPSLCPNRRLDAGSVRFLTLLQWPGNLRALRSVIYQTLSYTPARRAGPIGVWEIFDLLSDQDIAGAQVEELRKRMQHDCQLLLEILRCANWNVSHAAKIAGLSRTAIYNQMKKNGWSQEGDC